MENESDKLDIYKYISSPDDADYWRKSGKTFSPLEMAVIVNRSSCTIKQKHEAFRIILSEYEDEWVTSPKFEFPGLKVSLHKALTHIIEDEQQKTDAFLMTDPDSVFQLAYHVKGKIRYERAEYRGRVFSSFENAIEDLRTKEADNDSGEVRFYKVYKYFVDDIRYEECCIDLNGDILHADWLSSYNQYGYHFFEDCWSGFLLDFYVEIPTTCRQRILSRIYHRIIHR